MEKQVVLEYRCPRENTLQFLVNKANMLNVRFTHSTWTGITIFLKLFNVSNDSSQNQVPYLRYLVGNSFCLKFYRSFE